ncbi:glycosyltransferase involved in cell wall biosynthesis [Salinibacter ruber]|uniref:glycosyltransferase family 4 protein n=1 Tax=Salinibacter ruber TaxID=146919 RepID=UPI00216A885B|nr:glycosyltransferase family 4 protein [Salinibacter ruber]MCS4085634.1 glycosyltransferase involved in cell wall biosynthesis [Salinibacter ruber]
MNLVYLCGSIIPSRAANSVHVMKMCQALARNGHSVTLLAPMKRGEYESGVDDVFDFYDVERIFELRKLPCPRIKGRSIIYAVAAAWAVQKLRPDLVFGRYVHGCALTAWMGYPTIFECHQPIWEIGTIHHGFFELLRRGTAFQKFVVISEALKEIYMEEKDMSPSQIIVAHDAADDPGNVDKPAVLSGAREEALQVGYVGNLYSGKGMSVIAEVAPRMPDLDFHVLGGAEDDIAEWKQRVEAENVIFHGFVNQSEVPRYMEALDVCLLPNQRTVAVYGSGEADIGRYTSPLKMFEYMSHGKPIIASDLPVLREVLTDGKNAVLCNPEDSTEWIRALRQLNDDSSRRCRLGEQARRDFEAEYTWSARAKRILTAASSSSNFSSSPMAASDAIS